MSTTLPALDIVFSIETYRFSIAARDGNDIRILILQCLEQRLRGSPQTVERRVVMGRNIDVRLVDVHAREE